jgi:serine/threonine-protein kinase RsbT
MSDESAKSVVADPIRIRVLAESDVLQAVLVAKQRASACGLNGNAANRVATAVSELARNIIKYAGQGEILIAGVEQGSRRGVEIVSRDRGPGISDIEQAMSDHFSSSGTLGLGLPGVKRLMDEFAIESTPGRGTTVTITKWSG